MKKLFVLALSMFSVTICLAQRVTYEDLKYVLTHNVAQTEDYLSNKGFDFSKIDTIVGKENIALSYNFDKNSHYSIHFVGISKEGINNIFYNASAITNAKSDYMFLKSSIKKYGFVFISTETRTGNLIINYMKGTLLFSFWIKKNQETEVTTYYISLTDETQEKLAMGF
ncbi:hypothetical protein [Mucilaginibacter sp.]|jgi:hypothetical protein|uniref:hypothetical protein n=1 Tax=Mucilaginibacter sp. TaxID=1882438 RepID=UPI002CCE7A58|nr:hypothetical protein [Mucilaginibacter sp.]HTI60762.1 hypothetical protein [Mucilaginibacter sp.]